VISKLSSLAVSNVWEHIKNKGFNFIVCAGEKGKSIEVAYACTDGSEAQSLVDLLMKTFVGSDRAIYIINKEELTDDTEELGSHSGNFGSIRINDNDSKGDN